VRNKLVPALPWALPVLLFLLPPAFGAFFSLRDFVPYFLPLKAFAVQETLAGRLPWWNPFNGCGELFLTNPQTGLLYPLTWLFVLPAPAAGQLYQFLQLAAAALGMDRLARSRGKGAPFAVALGFAYGFSGPLLSCWDLPFNLGAMAWLPWTLWALSAGRAPLTALFLALGFLAGEPALFAAQLPLIVLFVWIERIPWRGAVRGALLAAPAVAGTALWLGMGLAGAARLAGEQVSHAGLRWADWAVCLAGPVLGLPFREPPAAAHDLYLPLPYLGAGLLLFALSGLAVRGRHRAYLVPALLFALLAMGEGGPLGAVFGLPGPAAVRFPARFLLLVPACLALLALKAERRGPLLPALLAAGMLGAWAAGRFHPILLVPPAAAAALALVPWRSRWSAAAVLADTLLVGAPLAFLQTAAVVKSVPAVRPAFPQRLHLPAESASFLGWVYPGGRMDPGADERMLLSAAAYANLYTRTATTATPHPLQPAASPRLRKADPAALGAVLRPALRAGALEWEAVAGAPVVEPPPARIDRTGRGVAFNAGGGRITVRYLATPWLSVRVDGRPFPWTAAGPWIALDLPTGGGHRVELRFAPAWAVAVWGLSALCWAALLCYAILKWKSPSRRSSA
jgi:hypothetical protein